MKQSISLYDFREAFRTAGRENQFSSKGLNVLFDCIESYEDSIGEEIELDVIAFCCEYSEDTPRDIADYYGIDISDCDDETDVKTVVMKYLEDNTLVCGETDDGSIVYQQF